MFENRHIQATIAKKVSHSGIGLHSGEEVSINLLPAKEDSGIRFIRTDISSEKNIIKANYKNVVNTRLCTEIANEFDVKVATIEHLMAALYAANITNIDIEISAPEVPIFDGSSYIFKALLEQAGIKKQKALRKIYKVQKAFCFELNGSHIHVEPANDFAVDVTIDFQNSAIIGKQTCSYHEQDDNFFKDFAKARTFCMRSEVEYMQSQGLAKGGSLSNAVVVDGDKILNPEGLRYEDELVRHKLLDFLGDMYLFDGKIIGKFSGYKIGHHVNNQFLRAFAENAAFSLELPGASSVLDVNLAIVNLMQAV